MAPDMLAVTLEQAVELAQHDALLVDRSNLGMLKFSGETRLDLIHRMSTQDVNSLQPGMGAATILTTDIGRIIDRLILYVGTQDVYALTGEENADNIARYLMRFVFFNDDFHIADLSAETRIWGVYGPAAGNHLNNIWGVELDLARHHWQQLTGPNDRPVYMMRTDPVFGDGYLIMSEGDDYTQLLIDGGLKLAGEEAFDYLRIASGRPRFGRELTSDYIPLEANLWPDVSFSKGCYIGQEIIARMESRGRIAKQLVRLRLDELVPAGEDIIAAGKKAGTITSVASGPLGVIGLGYVKTAYLERAGETDVDWVAAGIPLEMVGPAGDGR
jgi:aminomethyltransferase